MTISTNKDVIAGEDLAGDVDAVEAGKLGH